MAAQPRQEEQDVDEEPPDAVRSVTAYETCPGRFVFTENGNTDGWVATDLTVDPRE